MMPSIAQVDDGALNDPKDESSPRAYIIGQENEFNAAIRSELRAAEILTFTFRDFKSFTAAYNPAVPGCLFIEFIAAGASTLEMLHKLAAWRIGPPVVITSEQARVSDAVCAIQQGASNFLVTPVEPEMLLDVLREAFVEDAVRRGRLKEQAETAARLETLSPRERDILGRLIAAKALKQIASELGISRKTVEAHRTRILKKLCAESVVELVRAFYTLNLLHN